jgi:hypothetical protein
MEVRSGNGSDESFAWEGVSCIARPRDGRYERAKDVFAVQVESAIGRMFLSVAD